MEEKIVTEKIIDWLIKKKKFKVTKKSLSKKKNESGIDIRANKNGDCYIIECKGDTTSPYVDFYTCLGQIISRMKIIDDTYYYCIGLPDSKIYHKYARNISDKVRKNLKLRFLFVSALGDIKEIKPTDPII